MEHTIILVSAQIDKKNILQTINQTIRYEGILYVHDQIMFCRLGCSLSSYVSVWCFPSCLFPRYFPPQCSPNHVTSCCSYAILTHFPRLVQVDRRGFHRLNPPANPVLRSSLLTYPSSVPSLFSHRNLYQKHSRAGRAVPVMHSSLLSEGVIARLYPCKAAKIYTSVITARLGIATAHHLPNQLPIREGCVTDQDSSKRQWNVTISKEGKPIQYTAL